MKRNQEGHEAAVSEIYKRTSIKNPRKLNLERICKKHKICRIIGRSLISAGYLERMEDGRYRWIGRKNPSIPSVVEDAVKYSTQYKYGSRQVIKPQPKKAKTPRVNVTGHGHKQQTIELAKKFAGHGEIAFANQLMDRIK
jgi:hypothetical protein